MIIRVNARTERIPKYQKPGDVGADLYADLETNESIFVGHSALIPTGVRLELPEGVMAVVHPRSGMALMYGLIAVTGIIDTGYRGEIMVSMLNLGQRVRRISPGDRIAQLVFQPVIYAKFEQVDELTTTERGDGGFGHTGVK